MEVDLDEVLYEVVKKENAVGGPLSDGQSPELNMVPSAIYSFMSHAKITSIGNGGSRDIKSQFVSEHGRPKGEARVTEENLGVPKHDRHAVYR